MPFRLQDHTIAVLQDDNGTFVAYVPRIGGCHALGSTTKEAVAELVNVFEMMVEEWEDEGRTFPPETPEKTSSPST